MSHTCVKRYFMAHSLMADRTPQDQDKYIVRFPHGMRDLLKEEADKNGRSMNAEIITRLEASLSGAVGGGTVDQIFAHAIEQLMKRPEPPSEAQHRRLTNAYDEFRHMEVQALRDFLDLVSSLWREDDLLGLSREEEVKRAMEYEVSELRSRARRLGYKLVDDVDAEVDLDDVVTEHAAREAGKKDKS